jgi:mono/diheme cytochrome c family protein
MSSNLDRPFDSQEKASDHTESMYAAVSAVRCVGFVNSQPFASTRAVARSLLIVTMLLAFGAPTFAQYQGWLIPEGGKEERSPLKPGAEAVRRGQSRFLANCVRCHGPEGKGNGPDSDHAADLTDTFRDSINTEGVLFYKVWNGHAVQLRVQVDDMPAFKDKLARDDVWALVEYLKVLRTPSKK